MLACAPMAAEQRVGTDEVDGAGDPAPVALGHDQQDAVAHLLADERVELPRQIGAAPFARAGFHVEVEEGVPHAFGEIRTGQPMHADAGRERVRAFAPDGLALARGERRQERIEAGVAGVLPMELLVRALEVAARAQQVPFRLGREGDVNRRGASAPADIGERVGKMRAHRVGVRPRAREQSAAGRGRERHGNLQLRIVAAPGPLVGVRPAMVEDVFAARMGLHIAGDGAEQDALGVFGDEVHRLPTGAGADRLRQLERGQEIVRDKWVIPIS